MVLALTCALCVAGPGSGAVGPSDPVVLLEERLSIERPDLATPTARAPIALAPLPDQGSGDGDGHSDHMGPMWIVMGAMMVVMMVGAGIYFMNHGSGRALGTATAASPAQMALPVTPARAGGG